MDIAPQSGRTDVWGHRGFEGAIPDKCWERGSRILSSLRFTSSGENPSRID
jgi:hypothetical protein